METDVVNKKTNRNKFISCDICSKLFRSDTIKRHKKNKHSNDKENADKGKKQVKKKRSPLTESFIDNEATNEHSEGDLEIIESETQEDRDFIDDDTEEFSNEVHRRLQQLFENTDKRPSCKHCGIRCDNVSVHEKKLCFERPVKCHKCKKAYPIKDIKKHFKACKPNSKKCFICKKLIDQKEFRIHLKNCKIEKKNPKKGKKTQKGGGKKSKGAPKANGKAQNKSDKPTGKSGKSSVRENDKERSKRKKKQKGGRQFKLQFHGAKKYKIFKALCLIKRGEIGGDTNENANEGEVPVLPRPFLGYVLPDWIKQFIIGNEFGSGIRPNPHCHAVLVTKKKIKFDLLKEQWKSITKIKIGDIQSCKNIKHEVKYVCKEDSLPINYKFDWDMLSLNALAYIYAQKTEVLMPDSYPYVRMMPWQQRQFAALFYKFSEERKVLPLLEKFANCCLKVWQEKVWRMMKYKTQSDRQITWIVDQKGNSGKSFLANFLAAEMGAFKMKGDLLQMKDFAFKYQCEDVVVFDYPREQKESVNYSILEHLKDGYIFSSKYESHIKHFEMKNVQVLCLSNFIPEVKKLSLDRWIIFIVENNTLRKMKNYEIENLYNM